MASLGVASHARLQGFGQVVVLSLGMASWRGAHRLSQHRMCRGQTLRRRVEGECKVFSAECLNDANPIQAIVVFQCSQCAVRQQHLHFAALHTPPHRYRSATYQSPCPRRVWCELAGHYSPHRRARGHARRTRRCARVERHRHDIEQQRRAYARAPGGAASQRQRACTRSFSGP